MYNEQPLRTGPVPVGETEDQKQEFISKIEELANRERIVQREISVNELLEEAQGRTLVVGESHISLDGRDSVQRLLEEADKAGYDTLAVEVSERGYYNSNGILTTWGFEEEVAMIREKIANGEQLEEDDPLSFANSRWATEGPDWEIRKQRHIEERKRHGLEGVNPNFIPRFNRHWQIKKALEMGWEVIPVDPLYFQASASAAEQTFKSQALDREEPMVKLIKDAQEQGAKIVVVLGAAHTSGVLDELGDTAIGATSMEIDSQQRYPFDKLRETEYLWMLRNQSVAKLPRIKWEQTKEAGE